MIRKSIFTLMLLAVIGYVSAQTLQFELNGVTYENGETIICETEEYGEYVQHFRVRNLAGFDQDVMLMKEVVQDLDGVMNYFCWGSCYLPETMVSPRPVTIPANTLCEEDLSVHAMYDEEVFGDVIVKYAIYDAANPDERVSVAVRFHKSGTGVSEQVRYELGHAYPNPATSTVRFDYELSANGNASVSVCNLLGQEVMRQNLDAMQGHVSFSVSELNEGIYFSNLMINGRIVKTEKFVVKK